MDKLAFELEIHEDRLTSAMELYKDDLSSYEVSHNNKMVSLLAIHTHTTPSSENVHKDPLTCEAMVDDMLAAGLQNRGNRLLSEDCLHS